MVEPIKEVSKLILDMAMEYSTGLMFENMKVTGRKERCMEKAFKLTKMARRLKESGQREN